MTSLVVFDSCSLRLADHPALQAAVTEGSPIIPLFVWDKRDTSGRPMGGAAKWWLHHALLDLDAQLATLGSRLIIRSGDWVEVVTAAARAVGANRLCLTRAYEAPLVAAQKALKDQLEPVGIAIKRYPGRLLFEPEAILTKDGKPYTVFSPFWRNCQAQPLPGQPYTAPEILDSPPHWPETETIESLGLLPSKPDWAGGIRATWQPSRADGLMRLEAFLADIAARYKDNRDRPDRDGTSRLSPYLKFGQLSVREVFHAAHRAAEKTPLAATGVFKFVAELGWREFSAHLQAHFPDMARTPLRPAFAAFPWQAGQGDALSRWQKGQTGFPIVDAGMRQLWQTGWMHNRVRMIVASFLVKELLWHWHDGEDWFWDTLVDADGATNAASWQWAAGCGADAAPYFRIFNPILQGEKFDPKGDYVRTFVPELANMPAKFIHQPWEATPEILQAAGVTLGDTYPAPIVDRKEARARALAAFEVVKAKPGPLPA